MSKGFKEKKFVKVLPVLNIKIWLDLIWEMTIKNILLGKRLLRLQVKTIR